MSLILPGKYHKKKAIVASFPRSGTHFLMNTLAENFGYQAVPFVDFSAVEDMYFGSNVAHWLEVIERREKTPLIIKTHQEVAFFAQMALHTQKNRMERVMEIALNWYNIFYIWRDPGPVMESYAKHLKANLEQRQPMATPLAQNGEELAQMEPWGHPLTHQMYQYPTFYDKWAAHVEGWKDAAQRFPIIVVKYEDLNEDFHDEIRRIGKLLNYSVLEPRRPSRDENVVKGAQFVGK